MYHLMGYLIHFVNYIYIYIYVLSIEVCNMNFLGRHFDAHALTNRGLNKPNIPTDLKGCHTFILFYFVFDSADPATFLALNNILWTFISAENSLFIQLWEK